jgi:ribose 5-phosphate isomerase B
MKIVIGSDHGGFRLKSALLHALTMKGFDMEDVGTSDGDHAVDYPDFAAAVARKVVAQSDTVGIVLCGTGIGACIAANKIRGIRCALVHDCYTAQRRQRPCARRAHDHRGDRTRMHRHLA